MLKLDLLLRFACTALALPAIAVAQSPDRGPPADQWNRLVLIGEQRVAYDANPFDAREAQLVAGDDSIDDPSTRGALVVEFQWQRSTFGTGIGARGLHIVDLDGDTQNEIVATASTGGFNGNRCWYILSPQGAGYDHTWVSPVYPVDLTCLRIADADGDSDLDVLVALGASIFVYDGASRELLRAIAAPASNIRGLNIVDVDGDGQLELVFLGGSAPGSLYILNLATGATEYSSATYGGSDVAVGNVDADADLEIVVGNGASTGYVLNGATRVVEWSYPSGFGVNIRLGDIDGDGMSEIVGAQGWNRITTYDGDVRSPKYDIPTSQDISAVRVADVDQNGSVEIVYGDGQWGEVHVMNGTNGVQLFEVANPEHSVTDIAIGELDDDDTNEIAFGAGFTSTGADYLYVADSESHLREWQSIDFSGPFYALDAGDTDNDGRPELLYGCFESESGYDDGLYFIHDAITGELEYASPPPTGSNWTGLWRVAHANIDDDPQQELFITTSTTYSGILRCYDGLTQATQWSVTLVSGLTFRSVAVADVDLDGQLEVVAATVREHTGAPGVYMYVFDAATGAEEWHSVNLGTMWAALNLLRVANVDADPQPEMIVAELGGQVFIHDGITHVQELQSIDLNVSALEVADADNDGVFDLYIGNEAGNIRRIDVSSGNTLENVGTFNARIDGLQIARVAGESGLDFVFCVADRMRVWYDEQPETYTLWTGPTIGAGVGVSDSLLLRDTDWDGVLEAVVNIGLTGVQVYSIPESLCLGDLNGDRRADLQDLATLLAHFGSAAEGPHDGDLDATGDVSLQDLALLLANFGTDCR